MKDPKDVESFLVETKDELRQYLDIKSNILRLEITEKVSKSVGILVAAFIIAFISLVVFSLLILLAGLAISQLLQNTFAGFGIVTGACLLLLVITVIMRKSWIERPVTNLLIKLFLNKDKPYEA